MPGKRKGKGKRGKGRGGGSSGGNKAAKAAATPAANGGAASAAKSSGPVDAASLKAVVGVHLGATAGAVAVWADPHNGVEAGGAVGGAGGSSDASSGSRASVIANADGARTTASIVVWLHAAAAGGDGSDGAASRKGAVALVGDAARAVAHRHPRTTVRLRDVMQLLRAGKEGAAAATWPWPVEWSPEGTPTIALTVQPPPVYDEDAEPAEPAEVRVTAVDALALMYGKLRDEAESYLGQPARVVAGVPASMDAPCRDAVLKAAEKGGLRLLSLVPNHVAAAVAFGLDDPAAPAHQVRNVVVYDAGGSSVEAAVLQVSPGGVMRTLGAPAVDYTVGGDAFDEKLFEHCVREFQRKVRGADLSGARARTRLLRACEECKRALTRSGTSSIAIDSLWEGVDFNLSVSRQRMETLCSALYTRAVAPIGAALEAAGLTAADVTDVLCIGGASQMPQLQAAVAARVGGAAQLRTDVAAEEAVALGAALQAALLTAPAQPLSAEETHATVAVAPAAISVATAEGQARVVIPKGTALPASATVAVAADDIDGAAQGAGELAVLEGDALVAAGNRLLGRLVVELPAAGDRAGGDDDAPPAAPASVSVSLQLTEAGELRVSCGKSTLVVGADAAAEPAAPMGVADAGVTLAALAMRREVVEYDGIVTASLAGRHGDVADGYELDDDMKPGIAAAQATARRWLEEHPAPAHAGAGALNFTAAEAEEARDAYMDAVEDIACGDEEDSDGEDDAGAEPAGDDMD